VSGESGAAGFAALQVLCANDDYRVRVGLDAHARVVLINTEGATAPALYEELTGRSAAAVLAAQATWLERAGAR
jgi:diaminopropionate ammonia-lyase